MEEPYKHLSFNRTNHIQPDTYTTPKPQKPEPATIIPYSTRRTSPRTQDLQPEHHNRFQTMTNLDQTNPRTPLTPRIPRITHLPDSPTNLYAHPNMPKPYTVENPPETPLNPQRLDATKTESGLNPYMHRMTLKRSSEAIEEEEEWIKRPRTTTVEKLPRDKLGQ